MDLDWYGMHPLQRTPRDPTMDRNREALTVSLPADAARPAAAFQDAVNISDLQRLQLLWSNARFPTHTHTLVA